MLSLSYALSLVGRCSLTFTGRGYWLSLLLEDRKWLALSRRKVQRTATSYASAQQRDYTQTDPIYELPWGTLSRRRVLSLRLALYPALSKDSIGRNEFRFKPLAREFSRSCGVGGAASAEILRPFCPVPQGAEDCDEPTPGSVKRFFRGGRRHGIGFVPGRGGGAANAGSSSSVRVASSGTTACSGSRSASSASSVQAETAR